MSLIETLSRHPLVVAVGAGLLTWGLTWLANLYAFRRQRRFKLWERQIERVEALIDSAVGLVVEAEEVHELARQATELRDEAEHWGQLGSSLRLSTSRLEADTTDQMRPGVQPALAGGAGADGASEDQVEDAERNYNEYWAEAQQTWERHGEKLDSLLSGIRGIEGRMRALGDKFSELNKTYGALEFAVMEFISVARLGSGEQDESDHEARFQAVAQALSAFLDSLVIVRDELPRLTR